MQEAHVCTAWRAADHGADAGRPPSAAAGAVVRVRDVVAEARPLAAHLRRRKPQFAPFTSGDVGVLRGRCLLRADQAAVEAYPDAGSLCEPVRIEGILSEASPRQDCADLYVGQCSMLPGVNSLSEPADPAAVARRPGAGECLRHAHGGRPAPACTRAGHDTGGRSSTTCPRSARAGTSPCWPGSSNAPACTGRRGRVPQAGWGRGDDHRRRWRAGAHLPPPQSRRAASSSRWCPARSACSRARVRFPRPPPAWSTPSTRCCPVSSANADCAAELADEFAAEMIPVYPATAKADLHGRSPGVSGRRARPLDAGPETRSRPRCSERHGDRPRELGAAGRSTGPPTSDDLRHRARQRLKWDEAFTLQAALAQRRRAAAAMPVMPRPAVGTAASPTRSTAAAVHPDQRPGRGG